MHHSELGFFIETIEDYFLVSSFKPTCQVFPLLDHETSYKPCNGIKILCTIQNGYIQAEINSPDEDSNAVNLSYFSNKDKERKYNEELDNILASRRCIREILTIDMSGNSEN